VNEKEGKNVRGVERGFRQNVIKGRYGKGIRKRRRLVVMGR